jgi:hypothetical protein
MKMYGEMPYKVHFYSREVVGHKRFDIEWSGIWFNFLKEAVLIIKSQKLLYTGVEVDLESVAEYTGCLNIRIS